MSQRIWTNDVNTYQAFFQWYTSSKAPKLNASAFQLAEVPSPQCPVTRNQASSTSPAPRVSMYFKMWDVTRTKELSWHGKEKHPAPTRTLQALQSCHHLFGWNLYPFSVVCPSDLRTGQPRRRDINDIDGCCTARRERPSRAKECYTPGWALVPHPKRRWGQTLP